MEIHALEIIVLLSSTAMLATNVLTFMETTRQFREMKARGNKILWRLSEIIEELKE